MSSSRRRIVIGAAAVLGWLSTGGVPSIVHASELCKTRRGGLIVRDTCKAREQKLDAATLGALGLRGPAGPGGPPGAPGGGLHVVDASGSEVGLVTSLDTSYYGQYARLLRETGLPGGTGSEFIQFSVNTQGVVTSEYACNSYYGTYFKTADCAGQRYEQCEYGNCSSIAGAFLFTRVSVGPNEIGCFTRGGSEFERGDFFRKSSTFGDSIAQAVAACTDVGGTLLGSITQCGPNEFCGDCCRAAPDVGVAPIHEVDFSNVGTPPFRLSR
jgi:hypothetical protein